MILHIVKTNCQHAHACLTKGVTADFDSCVIKRINRLNEIPCQLVAIAM